MNATATPGTLKKFRRTPWRFQQTVELPGPNDRDRFISTIIAALDGLESAAVTIDNIVFNTERMAALCSSAVTLTHDTTILAQSPEEMRTLLLAAFDDGPDFICIPTPKPFVFYSDHHDLTTFYANTKSNLNRVIAPLASQGYRLVRDWQREL